MDQRNRHPVRLGLFAALFAFGAGLFALSRAQEPAAPEPAAPRAVAVLSLNGPVTPANAGYLEREIAAASGAGKELIVIEIDTPGGLVDSMKQIVKAILASDTPVATFVSPKGARSASAGLYIMYAAHVSAMAPATNTGAATPVDLGGGEPPAREEEPARDEAEENAPVEPAVEPSGADQAIDAAGKAAGETRPTGAPRADEPLGNQDALRAKAINDSVAYIRALAAERGRNADWAERAVREAISVPAQEALDLNVIDLIAEDLDDLLAQLDGRVVAMPDGPRTLATSAVTIERAGPTALERFLGFLADPNVAVILMSLATTGIIIEMWNPGSIFPGVMGLACLILGLYAFSVLPYEWLGVALMLAGALFMAVEAFTPTLGLAGIAGLGLFAFGIYVVFPDGFEVSTSVLISIVVLVGGFLGLVLLAIAGSRSHGPLIGGEAIRRREGVVEEWDGQEGWVIVEGERWRARADKPLKPGDKVKVVEIEGLVLVVRQAKGISLLPSAQPAEA